MEYCAGVWGFNKYDKPNSVQHRAISSFLGVHRYTSNVAINGDMGWTMPVVRRRLCMFSLLQRILKMNETRFTKKILRWDFQHKGRTWSWQIRKMLKSCNEDFTLNDDNIDFSRILPNVKNHLMSEEIKIWKKDLGEQPKLRFYREFKLDYKTETYVKSKF